MAVGGGGSGGEFEQQKLENNFSQKIDRLFSE